jgi:hypothetical protein
MIDSTAQKLARGCHSGGECHSERSEESLGRPTAPPDRPRDSSSQKDAPAQKLACGCHSERSEKSLGRPTAPPDRPRNSSSQKDAPAQKLACGCHSERSEESLGRPTAPPNRPRNSSSHALSAKRGRAWRKHAPQNDTAQTKRRLAGANPLLIVSLVLSAFFALWLTNLGSPSLSGDESFIAILTAQPTGEILQRLNSDEPHPPVYYLAMHAWQSVAGNRPETMVRFPSVWVGVLLLALVYRLGRELGLGRWTALIPMAIVGCDPQLVLHLREARMYGPMVTSVALLALVALRFERLPRRAACWIAVGVTALALLTHYFNVLFVATIGLWRWSTLHGAARRRWLASQAVAGALLAVWLPLMGRGFFNPASLEQGKTWSFILPPWETLARLIKVGVAGYRDTPDLWIGLLGGGLLIGGWLIGSLHAPRSARGLLLSSVAAPLIGYALLCWIKPLYHPKYMLPWLLFAALAIGCLAARRPRWGGGVALALLGVMALPMGRTLDKPYDPGLVMSPNEWLRPLPRQLSQQLTTWLGPTDVFGLGTPDAAHCYYANYYFDRPLGCELIPLAPGVSVDQTTAQLDSLFAQHAVLWYLDYYNPAWDPAHVADAALAASGVSLGTEQIAGSRLRLYTSPPTIACTRHPVGARFGAAAELTGILGVRGGALHVVLNWRALADHPPLEAKVFIHVIDSAGQLVAQDDGVPVDWTRPLSTWQRDEHLLDIHQLVLPANAEVSNWSIRIGWYDAATGVRLPAFDRAGERQPADAVTIPLTDVLGAAACAR